MPEKYLILPNHIFDKKYLTKTKNVIIYEHPHYFTSYKFNKKKLMLHRSSMKYYQDYLIKNRYNVKYVEFNKSLLLDDFIVFNPLNKLITLNKATTFKIRKKNIIESPNMLMDSKLMEKYRRKTNKFFFNAFYMWSKNELNIITNLKSQDKDNRKKMPISIKPPKLPTTNKNKNSKYIKEASEYINKHFSQNYGTANINEFIFPITYSDAKKWLKHFIQKKFKLFGDYQDSMSSDNNYLFHSVLSTSINIGLINPAEIIQEIRKYKDTIPVNSYEGYIRQLFWREYQLYTYTYCNFSKYIKTPYFVTHKKNLSSKWYDGTIGILPVDNAIKSGFKTGYLNHIQRLMLVGNYMSLSGVSPKEGFKWFMEFSCDSYEWVMEQNVYEMVFFVTGGMTMRRPYISSSNYILKMSNYKKDIWCEKWDKLYYEFIKKNKKQLHKYRYFYTLRNLSH